MVELVMSFQLEVTKMALIYWYVHKYLIETWQICIYAFVRFQTVCTGYILSFCVLIVFIFFKREKASARASNDRFPCPCPCPLSLIMSNYPKSTSTHSDLPNILKNPNRIPKEFPKNSQRIPKEFPKNSQSILIEFTNNSQTISKSEPPTINP